MNCKRVIIKGTILLTVSGIVSRLLGFFFRIYLSHTFSPAQIGLYQLIVPVYFFMSTVSSGGIKTASIQLISASCASKDKKTALNYLKLSLTLSLLLSLICVFYAQKYSVFLSDFLLESRNQGQFIALISLALPFSAVHNCITGYCIASGNYMIPSSSQILEQTVRIFSVVLLSLHENPSIRIIFLGLILSEIGSCAYCIMLNHRIFYYKYQLLPKHILRNFFLLVKHSLPYTLNQVLPSFFHTAEAFALPVMLHHSGLNTVQSLSIYGTLTGISMPCIMFPSVITQSLATTLLPAIADLKTRKKAKEISALIKRTFFICISFGTVCTFFFFFFGNFIGTVIFRNPSGGIFMRTLSFICPFLYGNSALMSCLNGLGRPVYTLLCNVCSVFIRICCIFLCVPTYGIVGYLWGMLLSQIFISLYCLPAIRHLLKTL